MYNCMNISQNSVTDYFVLSRIKKLGLDIQNTPLTKIKLLS